MEEIEEKQKYLPYGDDADEVSKYRWCSEQYLVQVINAEVEFIGSGCFRYWRSQKI